RPLPSSQHFPYTTLFRSFADPAIAELEGRRAVTPCQDCARQAECEQDRILREDDKEEARPGAESEADPGEAEHVPRIGCEVRRRDRKSTRLNSSHVAISY